MPLPLDGRLALVTGASRGIGYAAALALAKAGADIIAVARPRSQSLLEDLDDAVRALGRSCTLVPMDLKDGDAIDRLGGAIYERWGRLDILVGNAGQLGPMSPLDHVDPKAWDEVMAVNVTANWRLIRSMHPLLKVSDGGRAIFVTSGAAAKNRAFWGPYAASKAALEKLVATYSEETKITNIKVNMIDPGPMRTQMRAAAKPGEDPSGLPSPDAVGPLFVDLARPDDERSGELVSFYDWAGLKRPGA